MWNAEWQEPFCAMFIENSNMRIGKIYSRLVGVQEVRSETGNIEQTEHFMLSLEKGFRMVRRVASHVGFQKSN
jgi:hypothetical protein